MSPVVVPKSVARASGRFSAGQTLGIASIHREHELPFRQLSDELATRNVDAHLTTDTSNADILVRRSREISHPEGYRLQIAEREQLISHRDALSCLRNDLERTWLARNRRSRLVDSIVGFDRAIEELDEIMDT